MPAPLLGISFVLAGLISLVWSIPTGIDLGTLNGTAWGALGVLSVLQTTVGYLAFYAGLQRGVSSTAAAVLSLLEPVAATALAILLLGQHLAVLTGAGIALLLAAVLLVREQAEELVAAPDLRPAEPILCSATTSPAPWPHPGEPGTR